MKTITQIAREVRSKAESYADEHGYSEDLGGMCAVASAALHFRLLQNGYKSRIVWTSANRRCTHCFVEVNKKIVDITASQFGLRRIEIRPKNDEYYTGNFIHVNPSVKSSQKLAVFGNRSIKFKKMFPMRIRTCVQFAFQDWSDYDQPSYKNILDLLRR